MARATGRKIAQEGPPLPADLRYLWSAFSQLHRTRQAGMSLCPITHAEIDAWSRLYRVRLDPWEVDALRALDDAFLETHSEGKADG